jgi:PIN domain
MFVGSGRGGQQVGGRCQNRRVSLTYMPWANLRDLQTLLDDLLNRARSIQGPGVDHQHTAYFRWVGDAERRLTNQVRRSDIERLFHTPRYWALAQMAEEPANYPCATNEMLNLEMEQRVDELQAIRDDLERQIARWSILGHFAVPDTGVFVNHESKIRDIDWAPLLGSRSEPVHLLLPIAVVDELDDLKEHQASHVRWRAGHTLGVLTELFRASPDGQPELRPRDPIDIDKAIPSGPVTIQVLLDPPGHVRLPITDDEIIARALAVQPLVGRPIAILTYDNGMAFRARSGGLRAVQIARDIGPEPKRGR